MKHHCIVSAKAPEKMLEKNAPRVKSKCDQLDQYLGGNELRIGALFSFITLYPNFSIISKFSQV